MPDRISQLLSFLEDNPDDSFLLFALAKEYENIGKNEEAILIYEQLISSKYLGAYYHFAKKLEQEENSERAFIIYREGIEVARSKGDMHALSELQNAKLNLENEIL